MAVNSKRLLHPATPMIHHENQARIPAQLTTFRRRLIRPQTRTPRITQTAVTNRWLAVTNRWLAGTTRWLAVALRRAPIRAAPMAETNAAPTAPHAPRSPTRGSEVAWIGTESQGPTPRGLTDLTSAIRL